MRSKLFRVMLAIALGFGLVILYGCAGGATEMGDAEAMFANTAHLSETSALEAEGATLLIAVKSMDDFNREMQRSGVALVFFHKEACATCVRMTPLIQRVAGEYKGRVRVVDVKSPGAVEVVKQSGVQGYPTVWIVRDGRKEEERMGMQFHAVLTALLDRALERGPAK